MFRGATTDSSRFPPRCCSFFQIHTALVALGDTEVAAYRAKFEEWVTRTKLYCPSPICSAFIAERYRPEASVVPDPPTLKSLLADIMKHVIECPAARFFRGHPDITTQRGFAEVPHLIDLKGIQANVKASHYSSVHQLTQDMSLIVSNAKTFYNHGPKHPVAKTADQLFECYLQMVSTAMDTLVQVPAINKTQHFLTCPKCQISICVRCMQIEHGRSACDTSVADHEMAMLDQFGYKRCPFCKHAVRKMYGCSHMVGGRSRMPGPYRC